MTTESERYRAKAGRMSISPGVGSSTRARGLHDVLKQSFESDLAREHTDPEARQVPGRFTSQASSQVLRSMVEQVRAVNRDLEVLSPDASRDQIESPGGSAVPYATALRKVVSFLTTPGENLNISEALATLSELPDIRQLRRVLIELGFPTTDMNWRELGDVSKSDLPCLLLRADQTLLVVSEVDENAGVVTAFDCHRNEEVSFCVPETTGHLVCVHPKILDSDDVDFLHHGWLAPAVAKFRGTVAAISGLSLLIALLVCAGPFVVHFAIDTIAGTYSAQALMTFMAGATVLSMMEYGFRRMRGNYLAFLGARIDRLLATALARLNLFGAEGSDAAQSAVKNTAKSDLNVLDQLRSAILGEAGRSAIDVPVAIVAVIGLFYFSVSLGMIALITFSVVGIGLWIRYGMIRAVETTASDIREKRASLEDEFFHQSDAIQAVNAGQIWLRRYRNTLMEYSLKERATRRMASSLVPGVDLALQLGGIALLLFVVLTTQERLLQIGEAAASVLLYVRGAQSWRQFLLTFQPLAAGFRAGKKLDTLFRERRPKTIADASLARIHFRGVLSFRDVAAPTQYALSAPLQHVSLHLPSGHLVAVSGTEGSGKSTLLAAAAGLTQLERGTITLDGLPVHGLEGESRRSAIAYLPREVHIFDGSLAENVSLGNSSVSRQKASDLLDEFDVLRHIRFFPEGLDTLLSSEVASVLPAGLRQRIGLARVFSRSASLYILDLPEHNLDRSGDQILMRRLMSMKRRSSILFSTQRPSHMALADEVLVMSAGRISAVGSAEEMVPILAPALSSVV